MKFILVRHAETTANAGTVILGGKEGGILSQRGERQARALNRRFKRERILRAYCSSSNRARQTCEKMLEGKNCKVVYTEELREIDMGDLVGLSHEEVKEKYPKVFSDIYHYPEKKIPKGESISDVQKRVMPLIQKIAQGPGDPTILAVGHNVVNRVIISSLIGIPLDKIKNIKQKNAAITVIDLQPGFAQLYTLDNSLHSIK
jgi:broad specificity phosphatase PhoE